MDRKTEDEVSASDDHDGAAPAAGAAAAAVSSSALSRIQIDFVDDDPCVVDCPDSEFLSSRGSGYPSDIEDMEDLNEMDDLGDLEERAEDEDNIYEAKTDEQPTVEQEHQEEEEEDDEGEEEVGHSIAVVLEDDLPFPGFAPLTLGYLTQTNRVRHFCLRMITNSYPFTNQPKTYSPKVGLETFRGHTDSFLPVLTCTPID